MARINLLPYRDKQKKEAEREFVVMILGAVVIVGAVVGAIHMNYVRLIDNAKERNQYMQQRIAEVEKEIKEIETLEAKKAALLARMKVIQQLQSARPEIVHLFYDTAATLPEGVYLTNIKRVASTVELEGIAESNSNVSQLMRNLDASEWMTNPVLDVVDSTKPKDEGFAFFKLKISQSRPGQADQQGKDGQGAKQ